MWEEQPHCVVAAPPLNSAPSPTRHAPLSFINTSPSFLTHLCDHPIVHPTQMGDSACTRASYGGQWQQEAIRPPEAHWKPSLMVRRLSVATTQQIAVAALPNWACFAPTHQDRYGTRYCELPAESAAPASGRLSITDEHKRHYVRKSLDTIEGHDDRTRPSARSPRNGARCATVAARRRGNGGRVEGWTPRNAARRALLARGARALQRAAVRHDARAVSTATNGCTDAASARETARDRTARASEAASTCRGGTTRSRTRVNSREAATAAKDGPPALSRERGRRQLSSEAAPARRGRARTRQAARQRARRR